MNTIGAKPTITNSHTIPLDVFIDVASILLKQGIDWKVEGANEHENSLVIQVSTSPGNIRQKKAIENIQCILDDYGYYVKGSPTDDTDQDKF